MVTHYACNIQIFLGFYLGLGFESVFKMGGWGDTASLITCWGSLCFVLGQKRQLTFRKLVQLVERIEMRGEGENPVGRHLPSR